MISADTAGEPRTGVNDAATTAQVFGVDLDGWRPGSTQVVDAKAFGYPIRSLADLPAGRYRVQATINRDQTFRRSDGHTVKLPPDKWEGQQYASKPGNLYSTPRIIDIAPGRQIDVKMLSLENEIPAITEADFRKLETKYVKYFRMKSERLSKFWGRDVEVAAWVLLPWGFDEHPDARYPLMINHGHFPSRLSNWRETPPDTTLKPDYSARFSLHGYNRIQQEYAYQSFKDWTGKGFPRALMIEIQHATPFYDDSYAVNSANNGPYGDAITYELIPAIERRFRALGAGWARFLYGGSTGGWEALAAQIFYPDEYNGAYGACPDPVDFRAFELVDLYGQQNAYHRRGPFTRVPIPAHRDYLGRVSHTTEMENHLELALGSRGRSGGQFDGWQAVYSPLGEDGHPEPIFDKLTGEIDPEVAAHWREHYDLRHILERDWAKLAPKLQGKLNVYVGDMDNYYLNDAVYLLEAFLAKADPPYGGEIRYGDRFEHCWNGDPDNPNHLTRLRYHTMYLDKILRRIEATAPPGSDLKSWRY